MTPPRLELEGWPDLTILYPSILSSSNAVSELRKPLDMQMKSNL